MKCLGLTRKKEKLGRWGEPRGGVDILQRREWVGGRLEGGITSLAGRLLGGRERGAIFGLMPLGGLAQTQQLD